MRQVEQPSLFSVNKEDTNTSKDSNTKKKIEPKTRKEYDQEICNSLQSITPNVYQLCLEAIQAHPKQFSFRIYLLYAALIERSPETFFSHNNELKKNYSVAPEFIVLPVIIGQVKQKHYKEAYQNYELFQKWKRAKPSVYPYFLNKELRRKEHKQDYKH